MNVKRHFKKGLAILLAAALLADGSVAVKEPAESAAATQITNISSYYKTVKRKRVSVHDPSVVKEGDTYYIFGSHRAWAKSKDLETWETFSNNINTDFKTLFKKEFEWAALGDSSYQPSGNMWAPDVVWNRDLKKWCMYMSINGPQWNSSISMLTADHLDGDWTYAGTVLYSGFGNDVHDYKKTDYQAVTGDTTLAARYLTDRKGVVHTGWQYTYGAHAIDPCVFYDENGQLWIAYGSWSGGIYMFRLDNKTGFRDNSAQAKANYTDAYMGKKIGGSSASGEAAYVEYINGYYYLFASYGGLEAKGGYNMRVFRSKNPDGPYTDISGDDANKGGGVNGTIGERLMSYYKWSYWENAQVAQGHNSAFVDNDGNAYVVYHTRTDNGSEYHSVRVHQLFTTESGYLVAAPFEYSRTDSVKKSGYTADEIAGEYEILFQKNTVNEKLECNEAQHVSLTKDGKVTGDVNGTWQSKNGTANITLTVDGVKYEGVLAAQTMEETNVKALCFTAVGTNEICFWGAKCIDDAQAVAMAASTLSIPAKIGGDVKLPKTGAWGTKIAWSSDSGAVLSDGTVVQSAVDRKITVKATISKNDYTYTKSASVTVTAYKENSGSQSGAEYYRQDYESKPNLTALWSVIGTAALEKDTSNCVRIVPSGSGNRGAVSDFEFKSQPTGSYDVETDVMLTSSTGNNGSTTPISQLVFACEDRAYADNNVNAGVASGYILKLEAVGVGNQTFTINGNAGDTVTLPATDWIHVKVTVNTKDLTKAVLTVTNLKSKKTLIDKKEIKVNGAGKLQGLYLMLGRGTSSQAKVDNTVVSSKEAANYAALDSKIDRGNVLLQLQAERNVYSDASVEALKKAVKAGQEVKRDLPAESQNIINEAAAAIDAALNGLTCKIHTLDSGTVKRKPTAKKKGIMLYHCYQCSHTEERDIIVCSVSLKAAGYLGKSITLKKGKKVKLVPTTVPAKGKGKVKFKSSNTAVAAVSSSGQVRAKKAGTAKITAAASDGYASAVYTVKVVSKAKKVKTFKLAKTKLTVKKGKSAALVLKSMTKGGTDTFKYKSKNSKVAKADAYGVIRGVKKGSTVIRVTCGSKKVNVRVTVKK